MGKPLCLVHSFVCSSKNISGIWDPCQQSPKAPSLPTEPGVWGLLRLCTKLVAAGIGLGSGCWGSGCFFPRCWSSWLWVLCPAPQRQHSTDMAFLEALTCGEPSL